MFARVMEWLEAEPGEGSTGFDDRDIRISIAALFYRIVAVDGEIKSSEKLRLRELLQQRFSLEPSQIDRLFVQGQEADEGSAGIFPFAVVLNRQLTELERHRVFSQMQALAMADGYVHPLEQDLLDLVKVLLRLNS